MQISLIGAFSALLQTMVLPIYLNLPVYVIFFFYVNFIIDFMIFSIFLLLLLIVKQDAVSSKMSLKFSRLNVTKASCSYQALLPKPVVVTINLFTILVRNFWHKVI